MSIEKETIQHVARLARLEVSEDQLERMKSELGEILEYVEQLAEVQTAGVKPTSHVHGVNNAFREDICKDSLSVEELKEIAPDFANGGFRVPKVI